MKKVTTLPSTKEEEVEEDTPSITSIPPPDGGWGWMVVLASFMIHVIADGITYLLRHLRG
jgi:hypothetical protein